MLSSSVALTYEFSLSRVVCLATHFKTLSCACKCCIIKHSLYKVLFEVLVLVDLYTSDAVQALSVKRRSAFVFVMCVRWLTFIEQYVQGQLFLTRCLLMNVNTDLHSVCFNIFLN